MAEKGSERAQAAGGSTDAYEGGLVLMCRSLGSRALCR